MRTNIINKTKQIGLLLLTLSCIAPDGCNEEEVEVPHKGAHSPLMQAIADKMPYIQSVERERLIKPHAGVSILEAELTYCTKPTRLFIAEVDLNKGLQIELLPPEDKLTISPYLQTVMEQVRFVEDSGRKVWLATNGDFFSGKDGAWVPGGLVYKRGKALWTTRGYEADHAFYTLDDGSVHISTYEEFVLVESRVQNAVSGWERLVVDGKASWSFTPGDNSMLFHPRTCVGVSQDNKKAYFIVVDGRQPEYSNGMRIEDLALLCESAGCYQALNIDGGGSSTMIYREPRVGGRYPFWMINKPSLDPSNPYDTYYDPEYKARRVLNGFMVLETNN